MNNGVEHCPGFKWPQGSTQVGQRRINSTVKTFKTKLTFEPQSMKDSQDIHSKLQGINYILLQKK